MGCKCKDKVRFEAVLASGDKKMVASIPEANAWAKAEGERLEKVTAK